MNEAELAELVVKSPGRFAWFLGAGTSRSSGVPTADDLIWDLKCRIYNREQHRSVQSNKMHDEATRETVQSYFCSKGYPKRWEPQEYSTYFEAEFGEDEAGQEAQRQYIEKKIPLDEVHLSVGNRVLAALLIGGHGRPIFTTNFDPLVEVAVKELSGESLSSFSLNDPESAIKASVEGQTPYICKLHGDYRYTALKNVERDLVRQDEQLAVCFNNEMLKCGTVVVGYSGRDESVMKLFLSSLYDEKSFPAGLFWTGMRGQGCPPRVNDLIAKATSRGINAKYVEIDTFDALMIRIFAGLHDKFRTFDSSVWKRGRLTQNIELPKKSNSGQQMIRMNALPLIDLPSECSVVKLRGHLDWTEFREFKESSEGRLVMSKVSNKLLCWGRESDILDVFGSKVKCIKGHNIAENWSNLSTNMAAKSMLEEALCRSLIRGKPLALHRFRHDRFISSSIKHRGDPALSSVRCQVGDLGGIVPGSQSSKFQKRTTASVIYWAEAVRASVGVQDGDLWLLLEPYIWIHPREERFSVREFIRQRRQGKYNDKYNFLLSSWIECLLPDAGEGSYVDVSLLSDGMFHENPVFRVGIHTGHSWSASR